MTSTIAPADEPSVGVVILNHNCTEQTRQCVNSLKNQDYPNLQIIVVDNASDPANRASLKEHLQDLTVVWLSRNDGYGDGNNAGIERHLQNGAEYILVISPDVLAQPSALRHLVEMQTRHLEIGICGPVLHAEDLAVTRWTLLEWLGYQIWAHRRHPNSLASLPHRINTDFVEGGMMLIRSQLLREIGGFRSEFFLYYEECEFCLRARDAGWDLSISGQSHANTRWNHGERNSRLHFMQRNSILLARIRKKYLLETWLRNILLMPLYALLKGQTISMSWRAINEGMRLALPRDRT